MPSAKESTIDYAFQVKAVTRPTSTFRSKIRQIDYFEDIHQESSLDEEDREQLSRMQQDKQRLKLNRDKINGILPG